MQKNLLKITNYLRDNKERKFAWGEFDCCLFACDIIMLCGGDDFAKEVRGSYSTEMGSKRVLKKHFGTIEDAFGSLPEIGFNFCQRGDLTLFDTDKGEVMAMKWVDGYIAVSDQGMGTMLHTDKPIKSWRVG